MRTKYYMYVCTRIAKNKNANQIEGGLRSLPPPFQFQHPAYPIFWNTEIRLENQHKKCHVLRHVKVSGWTFDLVKRKKISRHFLHSFSKKMVFFHHFIEQYSTSLVLEQMVFLLVNAVKKCILNARFTIPPLLFVLSN